MRIGPVALTSPLRLAPMADISSAPFRLIAKECGSAMVTSEEIDATALMRENERTLRLAFYLAEERPIAMQLLGENPENLAQAAKKLESVGADIIDLNMGCPVPKVTKQGKGAALMRDPLKAAEIFKSIRRAIRIPFTIKIRGGWDQERLNAVEIAKIAETEGVDAVTVHPRTRSQQFTGKAPWDIIRDVVDAVKIPVTGNGDVKNQRDAQSMMKETGCQSVMIGRGALGQPWIFDPNFESLGEQAKKAYKWRVITRHRDLMLKYTPEHQVAFQIKKHLVWYAKGSPNAALLRHQIFTAENWETAWKSFEQAWNRPLSGLVFLGSL
ncbi:MAG: tRNA dihydrouridine synthase DusB [Elusimicrobia bacterium]|nr:tRNA dihydrouridine synthase DusB [Elusimicrobiota bacterium]